jgi:hypothetical protein
LESKKTANLPTALSNLMKTKKNPCSSLSKTDSLRGNM